MVSYQTVICMRRVPLCDSHEQSVVSAFIDFQPESSRPQVRPFRGVFDRNQVVQHFSTCDRWDTIIEYALVDAIIGYVLAAMSRSAGKGTVRSGGNFRIACAKAGVSISQHRLGLLPRRSSIVAAGSHRRLSQVQA